jgi:arylsulfatase A-like enzyme
MAGMLAAVDEAIGQIVASLEKSGQRNNTLIVLSSDNGGPNPNALSTNGEFRAGKGTLYEGGVRVCAFANWPGHIPAGITITQPMHVIDWYPTFVNLAGGSLQTLNQLPLDGRDVWPMLTVGAESPHDAILCIQSPRRAAIRMGDWKLIQATPENEANASAEKANRKNAGQKNKNKAARSPAEAIELYNLAADPGEAKNLASEQPDRVNVLKARLAEFLKDAAPEGHLGKER